MASAEAAANAPPANVPPADAPANVPDNATAKKKSGVKKPRPDVEQWSHDPDQVDPIVPFLIQDDATKPPTLKKALYFYENFDSSVFSNVGSN